MQVFAPRKETLKLQFEDKQFAICTNYELLNMNNFLQFIIKSDVKLDVNVALSLRIVAFDNYGMKLETPFEVSETFIPSHINGGSIMMDEELKPGKYAVVSNICPPVFVSLETPSRTLEVDGEILNTDIKELKVCSILPPLSVIDKFVHEGDSGVHISEGNSGETYRSIMLSKPFGNSTVCSALLVIKPQSAGELLFTYDVDHRDNLKTQD